MMTGVTADDFLKEIRQNAKEKDLIKAKYVLNHLEELDHESQSRVLIEICRAEDEFALPLLLEIITERHGLALDFPTLRQTLVSKIQIAPQVFLDQLRSKTGPTIRALMAELAAEVHLRDAAPILLDYLNVESDEELLESTLRALGRIGEPVCVPALADFLYAESPDLIHTAAVALAQLGTTVAVQRLAERLGRDMHLDLLILGLLADIASPMALEKLSRTLGASQAYLRVTAKKKLVEIGAQAIPSLVVNLDKGNNDLTIHSLNVLGEIGSHIAIPPIRNLLHNEPTDPNVRFAAFEALGLLPLQKQAYALAPGLLDPVQNVRAAAASAVDKSFNQVLKRGVANMLRIHLKEAGDIIRTIVDAGCERIFMGLIDQEEFREPALRYLSEGAHPDVRQAFTRLLSEKGYPELVERIAVAAMEAVEPVTKVRPRVVAVDDSRMVLKIIRGMLHKIGCLPLVFEFPVMAIEEVKTDKPDLLLTDLNMPEITGLDVTREVRRIYSKDELPIVMITTQQESTDEQAAYEAGVNLILHKPFTEDQIRSVVEQFVKPRRA